MVYTGLCSTSRCFFFDCKEKCDLCVFVLLHGVILQTFYARYCGKNPKELENNCRLPEGSPVTIFEYESPFVDVSFVSATLTSPSPV